MAFLTVKGMAMPGGAHTRVPPTGNHCGGWSGSTFNAPEIESRNSGRLNAMIIAALDRDSELRHEHLRKRWQGTLVSRCGAGQQAGGVLEEIRRDRRLV